MKALTFNLRLIEPVLAARPESGEENSSTSYNFIPGSMIRGALIKRYTSSSLLDDTQGRRLFLEGQLRFLNAYPYYLSEKIRMLPRPASWMVAKDQADEPGAAVHDFAVKVDTQLGNTKNPKGDYCARVNSAVELYTPASQVNVHNASDDPSVKVAGKSFVYRYETIAAGEMLSAAIIGDDVTALNLIKTLLGTEVLLGGSHTAGYGRAQVMDVVLEENDWHEYAPDATPADAVIVTLLSDTIVRGKDGQVAGDLDDALGSALSIQGLKHIRTYKRLRISGGFNRKAGLPLPQEWSIQAGSVFVYPAGTIDVARLRGLLEDGLGERRIEGFGRIAINWFTQSQLTRQPYSVAQLDPQAVSLSTESAALAKQMATRRLETLLDKRLVEAINGVALSEFLPQNSQLSRVRTAAQQAMLGKNLKELTTLLNGLKGARAQFERARISGRPMLDWLKDQADQHGIHQSLQIDEHDLPKVAGQTASIDEPLAIEYTARLIDGVMKKAVKQNQAKEAA